MGKDYERSKRKARRVLLFLSGMAVFLCILVLTFVWGDEPNFKKDLCYEIITGILFAGVTICMINLGNWIIFKEDLDETHDADMAKRIWSLLKAENAEDSIIAKLYDDEAASTVMRNSIAYFNKKLADDFCNLVSSCSKVLREDFTYSVRVLKPRDEKRCVIFNQDIRYKRHYVPDGAAYMRCGFALTNNALDAVLSDPSFFFREVISDKGTLEEIRRVMNEGNLNEILTILKVEILLHRGGKTVKQKDIKIKSIDNNLIVLEVAIPEEYLQESYNGMKCYEGHLTFTYDFPPTTNFYCVFADTMIGKTSFSITFDPGIVKNMADDLEFITFLTYAPTIDDNDDANSEQTKPDQITRLDSGARYETNQTIFPRSGLVVNWNPDDMNK